MDTKQQIPPSTALLPLIKPSSSTLAIADPIHESIGSDLSSPEVKSQVMLSSRSAPSSPAKLHSPTRKSKTIEELRRELLTFKGRSQDMLPTGSSFALCSEEFYQTREGHGDTSFASSKKYNLNEAAPVDLKYQALNESPCLDGRTNECCVDLGPRGGASTDPKVSAVGYSAQSTSSRQPLKGDHHKESSPPPHEINVKVPAILAEVTSSVKPGASYIYPPGNTRISPPFNSKQFGSKWDQSNADHPISMDSDFPPLSGSDSTNEKVAAQQHKSQTIDSPKAPWTQLFKGNRIKNNGLQLEFVPDLESGDNSRPQISFTWEEVHEELSKWENALIGYVIRTKPPFKLMKQYVDIKWKEFGTVDLYILKSGVFIFNFAEEESKQKILEMGPWSYYDKPLILKPWSPDSSYEKEELNTVPIWVRLPHLKLHFWSAKALSKITSVIGKPLFTDRVTATAQRLAFARVCVEISPTSQLPHSVDIVDHEGRIYQQSIEYEWVPKICDICKTFDHKQSQCPKVLRQEWRPKNVQANMHFNTQEAGIKSNSSESKASSSRSQSQRIVPSHNSFSALEDHQADEVALPNEGSILKPLITLMPILDSGNTSMQVTSVNGKSIENASHGAQLLKENPAKEHSVSSQHLSEAANSIPSPKPNKGVIIKASTPPVIIEPLHSVQVHEGITESMIPEAEVFNYSNNQMGAVPNSPTDQLKATEYLQDGNYSLDSANDAAENWELMLTKSQRKKRSKFLHALAQKEKALEAKLSARQSPK